MINVSITHSDGTELATIRISRMSHNGDYDDYTAEFVLNRGGNIGIHSRNVYDFPREELNGLALLLLALKALDAEAFLLDSIISPDMARRLRQTVREIQAGKG